MQKDKLNSGATPSLPQNVLAEGSPAMDLNPETKGAETPTVTLLLVYFLLCVSGNPAVNNIVNMEIVLVVFAIALTVLLVLNKENLFNRRFFNITGIFSVIFLFQIIIFSFLPYFTIAGFYVRLFIGFAVIRLVKNFPLVYIQVMFYLAIVSLCFHIPDRLGQYVGFDFRGVFAFLGKIIGDPFQYREVICFHTFMNILPERNAGMFWEPGAFAGYLIIAVGFLGLNKNNIPKKNYMRILIVLTLTLLSTQSTTGYLVYPLALLTHLNLQKAKNVKKGIIRFFFITIIIPIIFIFIGYTYKGIHFVNEKIEDRFYAVITESSNWHRSRFGSLLFDMKYIKERPLTGWGLHPKTRYALDPWITEGEGMGNGMSDFTAKFGITGMSVFLVTVFLGIYSITNRDARKSVVMLLVLIFLLQGEAFLGHPLFLGLMFLSCTQKEKRNVPLNPPQIQSS